MLYFGWIALDYRMRYRGLLERLLESGPADIPRLEPPQPESAYIESAVQRDNIDG
jgi:hypothetical protein